MDGVQTLLAIVVVTLTILLIVVGAQVLLIIIDLRKAIKRLNSILEDAILGGGLIRPEKLTGVIEILRKTKKLETRGETNL
ncbi:hypothetical protein HY503_00535 [Candidatus Woesebacteria bacterium]|nr:hypothetical protein [Candidatus Woesebacteria bacterium]